MNNSLEKTNAYGKRYRGQEREPFKTIQHNTIGERSRLQKKTRDRTSHNNVKNFSYNPLYNMSYVHEFFEKSVSLP